LCGMIGPGRSCVRWGVLESEAFGLGIVMDRVRMDGDAGVLGWVRVCSSDVGMAWYDEGHEFFVLGSAKQSMLHI